MVTSVLDFFSKLGSNSQQISLIILGIALSFAVSLEQIPYSDSSLSLGKWEKRILFMSGMGLTVYGAYAFDRKERQSIDDRSLGQQLEKESGEIEKLKGQIKKLTSILSNVREVAVQGKDEKSLELLKIINEIPHEITEGDVNYQHLRKAADWLTDQRMNRWVERLKESDFVDYLSHGKMDEFRLEILEHLKLLKENLTLMRHRIPRKVGVSQKVANPIAYERALRIIHSQMKIDLEESSEMEGAPCTQLNFYIRKVIERVSKE